MKITKKNVTGEYFIDWWLEKYHNTNHEKILKDHPDWKKAMDDKTFNSRTFYEAYQCTQDQHDEWYDWAISEVMRIWRVGKKQAKKDFAFPYLNTSPMIKS